MTLVKTNCEVPFDFYSSKRSKLKTDQSGKQQAQSQTVFYVLSTDFNGT